MNISTEYDIKPLHTSRYHVETLTYKDDTHLRVIYTEDGKAWLLLSDVVQKHSNAAEEVNKRMPWQSAYLKTRKLQLSRFKHTYVINPCALYALFMELPDCDLTKTKKLNEIEKFYKWLNDAAVPSVYRKQKDLMQAVSKEPFDKDKLDWHMPDQRKLIEKYHTFEERRQALDKQRERYYIAGEKTFSTLETYAQKIFDTCMDKLEITPL